VAELGDHLAIAIEETTQAALGVGM